MDHRPAITDEPVDYINPDVPDALPRVTAPLVAATDESLAGYGFLFDDPDAVDVEIVPWPSQGWRPLDRGTGDQAGTVSGDFTFTWKGEQLWAVNDAVNDTYLSGWSRDPGQADPDAADPARDRLLLWHANYHPDGGQLFYPMDGCPFVTALALPGDDVTPEKFVAFHCDGSKGLYIHPNVWHEVIIPLRPVGRFFDRQGRIHGRVSVNFPKEFGVFLEVPLPGA
ncbi:MAG: ureidoglycolate lyase [Rhodobacterales bacterium]|nr:ureidoglycolate lyase [Rhodobacterales bacterium]